MRKVFIDEKAYIGIHSTIYAIAIVRKTQRGERGKGKE